MDDRIPDPIDDPNTAHDEAGELGAGSAGKAAAATVVAASPAENAAPIDEPVPAKDVDVEVDTQRTDVTLPFKLDEVRTVMSFCVRRLVGLDSSDIQTLNEALCTYEGAGGKGPPAMAAARIIIDKYNKLNDLLEPLQVNGASVHDSTDFNWQRMPLVWSGALLLAIGVAAEMLAKHPVALVSDTYAPDLINLLGYIGPMAWGGLGATVFVIKMLSDKVSEFAYEGKRLSGTAARVFLGMVFGLLVVKGFDQQPGSLSQVAIAFLAGLGTKAVYAAIEALVNGIAAHISGSADGSGPKGEVIGQRTVVSTATATTGAK
jgi:hypothetical protein